jgi:NAD(P)-dependent dehydrogenase (short-subunit alcohol dehydrogenase family)
LIWLGAQVVLAEIDLNTGREAADHLTAELGLEKTIFIQTDVGDESSAAELKRQALGTFDKVDIVINNATITPMGAAQDVPLSQWDASYRVNWRGPVLLAKTFLPGILERDYGVFVCVASVGTAYKVAWRSKGQPGLGALPPDAPNAPGTIGGLG